MKRILFNASHPEELRLAIVDGQRLLDLDIESTAYQQKKGNVYKGKITRVEPSLEAAFVDYGMERQGFLPLKEISRIYFTDMEEGTPMSQVRIKDVIKEGQELIVQVEKEERGTKGAALTTFISLAGRYLVLMPNNPKGGGISRRIEGEERAELREAMAQLEMPEDCAIIARTAGLGHSAEELQWDLDYLVHLWSAISQAAEQPAPFLVYQEGNLVVRTIRDYLRSDIGEIVIDNPEVHERMQKFMEQVTPHNLHKLKLYDEETPLFSRFQIENQIESAFSREVQLSSGGSIVFDRTEALISIDVNSARATKGADIEETALNTNLEAAEEIALQLRLRDLGGLIVIDFIDMTPARNQRAVEQRLNDALKFDRARVQVGRISRFGLLEMSRQRLRPSLGEASSLVCPRCSGTGHIRGVQSSALHLLRLIQEEAMKENTAALHVHLPIATATFLLNEKRHELNTMESRLATPIFIIPSADMDTPHYRIRRLRSEDIEAQEDQLSYKIEPEEDEETAKEAVPGITQITAAEKPAVGQLVPMGAAPPRKVKAKEGILIRLFKALFGTGEKKKKPRTPERGRGGQRPQRGRRGGQRARGQGQQGRARGGQPARPPKSQQPKPKSAEAGEAGEAGEGKQEKPERKEGQQRSGRGRRGRGGRRQSQRARGGQSGQSQKEGADNQGDKDGNKAPEKKQSAGKPDEGSTGRVEAQASGNTGSEPYQEKRPQPSANENAPAQQAAQASTPAPTPKPVEPVSAGHNLVQIETKSTDNQG
ncbi:MAG: Rne/Rng family ribonuclease [Acidiferrobacterales bacterium]|nr:Rne/Rng family ribonuclease [Acidiferrobacterales bacterium]